MSAEQIPPCLYCSQEPPLSDCPSGGGQGAIRFGHYYRADDGKKIQRYKCRECGTSYSDASIDYCYRQKKRHLNSIIYAMLVSTNSQRRAALNLKINRKTIVRKFLFMGHYAKQILPLLNDYFEQVTHMQFDDLETSEHSKCKPVSVILAVEHPTRRILGFRVSSMPPKGTLVNKAMKKYGPRRDDRKEARRSLFRDLEFYVKPEAAISSDKNPHYIADVKDFFPKCEHLTYKGRRGCVVGQGELKSGGYDPLFSLNHTFAMLRANINRLLRRTWCTTKLAERLERHIAMYALYHNLNLIKQPEATLRTVS